MTESLEELYEKVEKLILEDYPHLESSPTPYFRKKTKEKVIDLFRQELKERLDKIRLHKKDFPAGSFRTLDQKWGVNHAIDAQDKLIKEQLEDL